MSPSQSKAMPSLEHGESDVATEEPQVAEKQMSTSKGVDPQLKNAESISREPNSKIDNDDQSTAEPKRTIKSTKSEMKGAEGNKRKRNPEDDPVEDTQLVKRLKLTIKKLEDEIKAKEDSVVPVKDRLILRSDHFCRAKARLQHAVFIPAEDQFVMLLKFRGLTDRISAWTTKHLVGVFEGETIPEEVEKMLGEVSERPFRKFLTAKSHSTMFFQALMWRFFCTEVLENPFKLWGKNDDVGNVLASIQSGELGGKQQDLDRWRGHTAKVLFDCPVDETKIQRLKGKLLQLVKPFIVEEYKDQMESQIVPGIEEVLDAGVQLARQMNRFPDRFEIIRKGPSDLRDISQTYDPEWMCLSGSNVDDHDVVDLLISPALVRYKKNRGSGDEERLVIEKAQVCYRTGIWFTQTDEYQRRWGGSPEKNE
ncbi:hypothetical protein F4818DRAFT_457672 [Hypoxylon cercidicola]|nr:hypothetical protein F4818DRAFT_457672 [Hypoxylon cercidicola]